MRSGATVRNSGGDGWQCEAPPIWRFAETHRFDGQFGADYIAEFGRLVTSRGAAQFEHRSVKRGRMGQQRSADQMIEAF